MVKLCKTLGIEFIETNKKQGCPYAALEGDGWKAYLSKESLPQTLTSFKELSRMNVGEYNLILEFWRSKKNNGKNPVVFTELPPKALKGRKPKAKRASEERGLAAKALGKLKEQELNSSSSKSTRTGNSPNPFPVSSPIFLRPSVSAISKDKFLPSAGEQSGSSCINGPQESFSPPVDREAENGGEPSLSRLLTRPFGFQGGDSGDASEKSWNNLFNSLSSGSVSNGQSRLSCFDVMFLVS